ncbi:hypothetical protein NEAUS04_0327 [Nematocida ausubeli]|nr:hypothetical protein NEAUS07_1432 [Nematocida ausubeli]KAI5148895.1 hypothetical protein NEAUS05_1564 [Nematocida ausubeli]KAI5161171.1 hypothetical protein NEAUS04_0327 [Nematocida ausubeli]
MADVNFSKMKFGRTPIYILFFICIIGIVAFYYGFPGVIRKILVYFWGAPTNAPKPPTYYLKKAFKGDNETDSDKPQPSSVHKNEKTDKKSSSFKF